MIRATQRIFAVLWVLSVPLFCWGALDSSDDSNLLKFTEEEVSRDLEVIENKESILQAEINQKIKTFHAYQNGATQPRFIWQETSEISAKRNGLKKILGLSITSGLKMLALLQDQKAALMNEKELLRVEKEQREKMEASASGKSFKPSSNYHFVCRSTPALKLVDGKIQVLESYGLKNDRETGVRWRNQGWWLGHVSGQVRSCHDGEVVFSGEIPGRGWVVMLDHGHSVMTVYANLRADSLNQIVQKGQKIAAGTILGSSREKFYFEARFEGKSVDPQKVLSSSQMQDFHL